MKGILSIIVLLCLMSSTPVEAQYRKKEKVQNLMSFDLERYHFGFVLSVNTSTMRVTLKDQTNFNDSLISVVPVSQPGFNLGMLASLDITPNWHLRFIPTLSFEERMLDYTFLGENAQIEVFTKNVSSTYIDFPLILKYRTNRINNTAFYVLGGATFGLDVATQENVNNNREDEAIVKIDNTNFSASFGFGVDFFLPYFKFGIELKSCMGLKNVLIDDNTKFTNPLESLKTQSFVISFTFEG
jgi:hypothetical protein